MTGNCWLGFRFPVRYEIGRVVETTDWSDDEEKIFLAPFHFVWTAYSGRRWYVSVLYEVPPGWERKKFEEGDGLLSDAPSVYIDVVGLCWAAGAGRTHRGKVQNTKPDQAQV